MRLSGCFLLSHDAGVFPAADLQAEAGHEGLFGELKRETHFLRGRRGVEYLRVDARAGEPSAHSAGHIVHIYLERGRYTGEGGLWG